MKRSEVIYKGSGQAAKGIITMANLNIRHKMEMRNPLTDVNNMQSSFGIEAAENPLLAGANRRISFSDSSGSFGCLTENNSSVSLCRESEDCSYFLRSDDYDNDHIFFREMAADTVSLDTGQWPGGSTCQANKDKFSFSSVSSKHKLLLVMMGFANFCAAICFSILGPFFPEEASKKEVSLTVIGLIFGVFELVSFLSCPVYGSFMTKIGSKFMFVSGIMVSGCCTILFGVLYLSPPGNQFVVICFLCRILEALGAAAFITSSFTILANAFPDYVATVMGYLEMFTGIGMMIGPAIGGGLYSVGGYGLPFYVMGGSMFFCGVLCYFIMPGAYASYQRPSKSILHLMQSPLALIIGLCIFSVTYSVGSLEATLAKHLLELNLSTVGVSMVFLVAPGLYALTSPLWGWISDTKGHVKKLIVVGALLSAMMFLMIGPSPLFPFLPCVVWFVVVSLVGMGIFLGCASIPLITSLVQAAKQLGMPDNLETFGVVSGFFNSCYSLGPILYFSAFVGSMTGGLFVDKHGFGWATSFSAGLLILSAVVLMCYSALERNKYLYWLLKKDQYIEMKPKSDQNGDVEMLCADSGCVKDPS